MRYLLIAVSFLTIPCLSPAQWTPFCTAATNGYIVNLEVYQDTLYAAGFPTNVCGSSVAHLGQFDGNNWTAFRGGSASAVHSFKQIGGEFYYAPYLFSNSGNHIYQLQNGVWQSIGSPVLCTYYNGLDATPSLYDVIEYNGELIACGEFDRVANDTVNCIMAWTGGAWQALGSGLTGSTANGSQNVRFPHSMYNWNSDLIVAGNFAMAGGMLCNGIARWNGSSWNAMGDGFDNAVYDVLEYNGELYACGAFEASGTNALERIAKWDGTNWVNAGFEVPGNSPPTFVHTLKEIGGILYVAGGFEQVNFQGNTLSCGNIISWDGTTINTMQGGTDLEIEGITEYNGSVLVGGGFTIAGNQQAAGLAYWNPVNQIPEFEQPELAVYPNPTSSELLIDLREAFEYQIHDFKGTMVLSGNSNGRNAISIGDLKKGQYTIQVNGTISRFVIQ